MEVNFLHNNKEISLWLSPFEPNTFFMEGKGPPIFKGDSLSWFGIPNVRVILVKKLSKRLHRIEVQHHKDKP